MVVWLICPGLWRSGADWLFHHDNAPAHNAFFMREFLVKNSMTPLLHLPYSPELAPCDLFLALPTKKRFERKTVCEHSGGKTKIEGRA